MTTHPNTQSDASQIAREIRAGLEGVTPGPWKYAYSRERDFTAIFPETARSEFPIAKMPGYIKQRVQDTDGSHLARCSPDRIAILLDAFDAQAREIAELREALEPLRHGIYIASKTVHAAWWRELRAAGTPIISTWIDEAAPGESASLSDLWIRCETEAATAVAMVLYREPGEVLKGAWVELGVALNANVLIFAVGISEFTVGNHPSIRHCATAEEAFDRARSALRTKEKSNG